MGKGDLHNCKFWSSKSRTGQRRALPDCLVMNSQDNNLVSSKMTVSLGIMTLGISAINGKIFFDINQVQEPRTCIYVYNYIDSLCIYQLSVYRFMYKMVHIIVSPLRKHRPASWGNSREYLVNHYHKNSITLILCCDANGHHLVTRMDGCRANVVKYLRLRQLNETYWVED